MKLINYQLQNQIELLSDDKPTDSFKAYLKAIIEDTTKPYHKRADYVGLSILELSEKITSLSNDISQLQNLKKKLSLSLEIAKEKTAEVFVENGIDRIDGNIISSLTLTKSTTKRRDKLEILDKEALMAMGFIKYDIDLEAIEKAIQTKEGLEEIQEYISITSTDIITPTKIKVNQKRQSKQSDVIEVDEIIDINQPIKQVA
jgi:hypothetical protein